MGIAHLGQKSPPTTGKDLATRKSLWLCRRPRAVRGDCTAGPCNMHGPWFEEADRIDRPGSVVSVVCGAGAERSEGEIFQPAILVIDNDRTPTDPIPLRRRKISDLVALFSEHQHGSRAALSW